MFFNKTIDLHFYTPVSGVETYASIAKAQKPKWLKNIPVCPVLQEGNLPSPSIKACPAVQDYYKAAIEIPLWSDLCLRFGPVGSDLYEWVFPDSTYMAEYQKITAHENNGVDNYRKNTDFQHLLITVPWLAKCNQKINFLMTEPMWQAFEYPTLNISQGITNFYYQHVCNVQLFATRTQTMQEIMLPHGMPLAHLIPLTDKKIKIHTHVISKEEYNKIHGLALRTKFTTSYYRKVGIMDELKRK